MDQDHMLANIGLAFFGKMSASVTHEIKNDLTIINESAGLLQDLISMSEKGHEMSLDRVVQISRQIEKRVHQADTVIKRLNRFSHCMDQPVQSIDLDKTVNFTLELASRLIQMRGLTIEVVSSQAPIKVQSHLFFLQSLIYKCVDSIGSVPGQKVLISFGSDSLQPSIWFSLPDTEQLNLDSLLASKEDRLLLKQLDLSVEKYFKPIRFGLVWPKPV